ncbi:MAG: prepilin peptidase [Terriglobia bacterium]
MIAFELPTPYLLLPSEAAYAFAALFGLVLGSFLNVCISRLPRHESVVAPRSRCPNCAKPICWYDNVPVLSYLVLKGKCRYCGTRISPVYPVVEILTACLFVVALTEFGPTAAFLKAIVFAMLLVILVFTDLAERTIPHSVTITGIILGLVLSFFSPVNDALLEWVCRRAGMDLSGPLSSFAGAVAGGIFGGGLLYGVAWLFKRFGDPEKEYLGFGDVMLMLMVGVFLGVPLTYLTILLGSVAGALIAVPFRLISKRYHDYEWPYGSFLAAAAVYALFGGQALIFAYLHWANFR